MSDSKKMGGKRMMRLRDLIRTVRACKTAAEERAVINTECAACRTAFKSKDDKFRHRNVAKLLYIHMLGYPTHFGQMECLKLIVTPPFPHKRIGYLGLMLLLDENQQILMLVTNSLKQDLTNPNPYVVGLALASLGNICSADMARDLSNEVELLFKSRQAYLRKKAALCAIRIIRKIPDVIEDFLPGAMKLLSDKNHAVLLTTLRLVIEMIKLDPSVTSEFHKIVPHVVKLLKNLTLAGFVSEYDVGGITDPFLQVALIHLLRLLGENNADASDKMNDVLAQVAIGTEQNKAAGNAILYETVMCIMSIESESGLRVLAINILGRFLLNRDNNIRYVALNVLGKIVNKDKQAIQRHRNTIVDCLKDPDISIRRRALDLVYALVTKGNVKGLVKELLAFLSLSGSDSEFRKDLTDKICNVADHFAPNRKWRLETVTDVLTSAGQHASEDVVVDTIIFISQSAELQAYAVHLLFDRLANVFAPGSQSALALLAVYVIGEYGALLISQSGAQTANATSKQGGSREEEEEEEEDENSDSDDARKKPAPLKYSGFTPVTESAVLDCLTKVLDSVGTNARVRAYILTALVKLTSRLPLIGKHHPFDAEPWKQ